MGKNSIEFENKNVSSYKIGSLLILEVKQDAFNSLINVIDSFQMLDWFKAVSEEKSLKGLLIIGEENVYCEQAYTQFLSDISGERISSDHKNAIQKLKGNNKRHIQINMLNNFARMFIENNKLIITAVAGSVSSPFWGLSLVSDLRIATINSMFHLTDKLYNLYPGLLPFCLMKHIGLSGTQRILYTKEFIDVYEALSLGLINSLVDKDNYKSASINYSINVLEYEHKYFRNVKKLITYNLLEQYEQYKLNEQFMVE